MNILEKIVTQKKEDLKKRKMVFSANDFISFPFYKKNTVSLRKSLLETSRKVGIIAEMKKASPSKGILAEKYQPALLFQDYQKAQVEGISVLTDGPFFQGSFEDLLEVRKLTDKHPILCKDFMIDSYQIDEAKGYGASAILLIAKILEKNQYQEMYHYAKSLQLDVLTEVHQLKDLEMILEDFIPEMIGINNRDLFTFQTSLSNTEQLITHIPKEAVIISESGIYSREQIELLRDLGVNGILVGEHIMKAKNRIEAIYELVGQK